MCEVSLPDKVIGKVREVGTAEAEWQQTEHKLPQINDIFPTTQQHLIPLCPRAVTKCSCTSAQIDIAVVEAIHPQDKCRLNNKQSHNLTAPALGRGCCSFSKGSHEPGDTSHKMTNHLKLDQPPKTSQTPASKLGQLFEMPTSTTVEKPVLFLGLWKASAQLCEHTLSEDGRDQQPSHINNDLWKLLALMEANNFSASWISFISNNYKPKFSSHTHDLRWKDLC